MFQWHKHRPPALLRALAADGRSGTYLAGGIMGICLLGGGIVMMSVAINDDQAPPGADEFALGIFGAAAIATGWALIVFSTLMLMAHETLFLTDDEYRRRHTPQDDDSESANTARSDACTADDRRQDYSGPRIISTSGLSLGWRLLVLVPLMIALSMIGFAVLAGLDPDVGVFAVQYHLPPSALCFGALFLMMLTALPLAEGAKRHDRKQNKATE